MGSRKKWRQAIAELQVRSKVGVGEHSIDQVGVRVSLILLNFVRRVQV